MSGEWLLRGATKEQQSITSDWTFTYQELIEGVRLREVKNVPKEGGALVELFRRDWGLDPRVVDQVFQVTLFPGTLSAWHVHEVTTDRLFVSQGLMKVVLYDARQGSPSYGQVNEFRLGSIRPGLIVVPPKVWHGVQNISNRSSTIVNIVDKAYAYDNPDHWRLPFDSSEIPYAFEPKPAKVLQDALL